LEFAQIEHIQMFDASQNIKLLIDEDLSPAVARHLCEELLIDAVRGSLFESI
jgi:hypothetical protein